MQGPSNPTVTAVSRTEVVVSWDPPCQILREELRRYEVYVNASTKPIYSGTQTFCHLRGLKSDFQYHFKILMVLKCDTVMDKIVLTRSRKDSRMRRDKHHDEKFQTPSSTLKRLRKAQGKSLENEKASRHQSCSDFEKLKVQSRIFIIDPYFRF
ncbi:unnamed protein product [Hydatigera taeniaeformis]|uniref:Fibronectin type-III domain-containing protein n=1 Tax=Hydatigena taeniaeformis TaxID=6205 RepID=A0A0R3WXC8_HYDTA|nr:unnamed protein product [Hydatigera taeniaeformis]